MTRPPEPPEVGVADGGDRAINQVFQAYRAAPGPATEAALLAVAPGDYGPWLRDVGDTCRDRPGSAWELSIPSADQWSRATWLRQGVAGPPRFGEPLDEQRAAAWAEGRTNPGERGAATRGAATTPDRGQWYGDFWAAQGDFPGSAWGPRLRPGLGAPNLATSRSPTDRPAGRRAGPGWRGRFGWRLVVPILVAVVVAVVVAVSLQGGSSPRSVIKLNNQLAAWKVSGFIDNPTWRLGQSARSTGEAALVTCASAGACYADQPGSRRGGTQVEVTNDDGATWRTSTLPAGWQLTSAVACSTAGRCVAAVEDATGGSPAAVLLTTDGARTWSVHPLPPSMALVTNLACGSPTACVGTGLGSSASGPTFGPPRAVTTSDGGRSWVVANLPQPFAAALSGLTCPTARHCLVVGNTSSAIPTQGQRGPYGAALVTTDGGLRWQRATVPNSLSRLRSVSCVAAACVALGNAPQFGGTGSPPYAPSQAVRSTDGGRTWTVTGSIGHQSLLTAISCPTAQTCWAVGNSIGQGRAVIEASRNGGLTWHSVALPTAPSSAQQVTAGISRLDIQNLASIACAAPGGCVAIGAQAAGSGVDQQVVLREPAVAGTS